MFEFSSKLLPHFVFCGPLLTILTKNMLTMIFFTHILILLVMIKMNYLFKTKLKLERQGHVRQKLIVVFPNSFPLKLNNFNWLLPCFTRWLSLNLDFFTKRSLILLIIPVVPPFEKNYRSAPLYPPIPSLFRHKLAHAGGASQSGATCHMSAAVPCMHITALFSFFFPFFILNFF
jgi:hypothetical protein